MPWIPCLKRFVLAKRLSGKASSAFDWRSRQRGSDLFEWNIQTGVSVWTPDWRLLRLTAGRVRQDQSAWEQLVHPEDRPEALRLVERSFETR